MPEQVPNARVAVDPLSSALDTSLTLVETSPGTRRNTWIAETSREMEALGIRTFPLVCDFDLGGPWAGIRQLFSEIVPRLETSRPDLIERHLVELVYVLPHLRQKYTVKHRNLTDLAPREEKSRFFAADRAYRVLHGLIDLIVEWKQHDEPQRCWLLICESYESTGSISARFFTELHRRLGKAHRISLCLIVAKGATTDVAHSFLHYTDLSLLRLQDREDLPNPPDSEAAAVTAEALEAELQGDRIRTQMRLPDLIRFWSAAKRPDKVTYYRHFALETYNTLGLYEDAIRYGTGLLDIARSAFPEDIRLQWSIVVKMLMSNMGLGRGPEGLQLALGAAREVAARGQKIWEGRLSYLIAMFYARYSKPRDYEEGVAWLERGLAEIAEASLPADEYHFESVFNRNGLAMIRAFQGRHSEAIDLCSSGLIRLNENLGTEKHLLHRSILLYNIAQVYVAMGKQEQALEGYSAVIEMDPNYSEYYNERGNLYLSAGRIDEACADYLRAIELSSPYYEVHTNLGQCYRQMGLYKDALAAYSRSLDLEPNHPLALAGRGQAYDSLGLVDQAIADYTAALNAGSAHWEIPANRGVLYYQTGNLSEALEDFNYAIELNPENADLYTNRSRLHQELGRTQDAMKDLYAAVKYCAVPEELEGLRVALGELETSREATTASVPA